MNNNSNFVDAFIHSVQIWNLGMDKEDSNMENIDQRAVIYFQHEIMVMPIEEERPEVYDNGGE